MSNKLNSIWLNDKQPALYSLPFSVSLMTLVWRMCYLLFMGSEFPKCHVLLIFLILITIYPSFPLLHPLSFTAFQCSFWGKSHFINSYLHFTSSSKPILFLSSCCWFLSHPSFSFKQPPQCSIVGTNLSSAMWWWLLSVLTCVLLMVIIIFLLTTRQRYKVFSEKCLRPPGPLVNDNKLRDNRLKRGKKKKN